MSTVLTTSVLVMEKVIDAFKLVLGVDLSTLDPSLSYDSSFKLIRDQKKLENHSGHQDTPFVSYNRSILKKSAQLGNRGRITAISKNTTTPSNPVGTPVEGIYAQFDLKYLYITKDLRNCENFEILSLLNKFPTEVTVNYGGIFGSFDYQIYWNDPDDLTFTLENTYYKGITGSATINGYYLLLDESKVGSLPLILEVNRSLGIYQPSIVQGKDISFEGKVITKESGGFKNAQYLIGHQISITGSLHNNCTRIIERVLDNMIIVTESLTTESAGSMVIISIINMNSPVN